jgi:hypothetical protein
VGKKIVKWLLESKSKRDIGWVGDSINMSETAKQITVPKSIYVELEAELKHTQFDDIDEYATYVFEELLHYLGESEFEADIADQDQLKDRLESLGYI